MATPADNNARARAALAAAPRAADSTNAAIQTVDALLHSDAVRKRFEDVLGKKAAGFMSSVIAVTNGSRALKDADPKTIIAAAAVAASLDLPINPSLGFAWIIPREIKDRGWVAQFQLGYKGTIQLALRSGQYKTIHVGVVYEGELEEQTARQRLTGELQFREGGRTSDKAMGYAAYFKLLNGAEMWDYMSEAEVIAHAQRFAGPSFKNPRSAWNTDPEAMKCKTVLDRLLSHYGILSVQMQKAQISDQGIARDETGEDVEHPDNVFDTSYSEGGSGELGDPEEQSAEPAPQRSLADLLPGSDQ
jgi:recombination protein RecT